ncbi:MAG: PilZ domain-containing protein [Hyphomicrobiales bacterium]|nr:PilZ domain-containing protein [Hyphomicrobiales bacterium]
MLNKLIGILKRLDRTRLIITIVVPLIAVSILFLAGRSSQTVGVCNVIKPLLVDLHESSLSAKTTTNIDELSDSIKDIEEGIEKIYDELAQTALSDPTVSQKRIIIDVYISDYKKFIQYYYSTNIDAEDLKYTNFAVFMDVDDPSVVYSKINCEPEEQPGASKVVNITGDQENKKSIYLRDENFDENIKKEIQYAMYAGIFILISAIFFAYLIYRSSRSDPRYDTYVETVIQFDEQQFPIVISNISRGGATIGPDYGFQQGDNVFIKIEENEQLAEVRWVWETHAGVKFAEKISKSTLRHLRVKPPKKDDQQPVAVGSQ